MKCIICGSSAINPRLHGREENKDIDLCDVCYWRHRADLNFSNLIYDKRLKNENKN